MLCKFMCVSDPRSRHGVQCEATQQHLPWVPGPQEIQGVLEIHGHPVDENITEFSPPLNDKRYVCILLYNDNEFTVHMLCIYYWPSNYILS